MSAAEIREPLTTLTCVECGKVVSPVKPWLCHLHRMTQPRPNQTGRRQELTVRSIERKQLSELSAAGVRYMYVNGSVKVRIALIPWFPDDVREAALFMEPDFNVMYPAWCRLKKGDRETAILRFGDRGIVASNNKVRNCVVRAGMFGWETFLSTITGPVYRRPANNSRLFDMALFSNLDPAPEQVFVEAAKREDQSVLAEAAKRPDCPTPVLQTLFNHQAGTRQKEHVLANPNCPPDLLTIHTSEHFNCIVAGNPSTTPNVLERLFIGYESYPKVRLAVAGNPSTPTSVLRVMFDRYHDAPGISAALATNPSAPPAIRAFTAL